MMGTTNVIAGRGAQGWIPTPIKDLVRSMQRGAHPEYAEDAGFFIVNQGCLSTYSIRDEKRRECAALLGRKGRYRSGDILLASTGEGVLGRCALAVSEGYCDSHVSIIKGKNELDTKFLYWWIAGHYRSVNTLFAQGSTKQTELQREAFLSHIIALPPRDARADMCDFLTRECSMLDSRVAALNEKRALLRELKGSIREELCFHGAQRGAEIASETQWHGAVPARWCQDRLGNLFREVSDLGHPDLPVLSVSIHSGISNRELNDAESDRKVARSENREIYKRVKPGDIVYNQMRAWQGGFGVAGVEGLVSPAYVVARQRREVSAAFVEHLLRTPRAIEEMRRRSRGIIDFRLRLYWDSFKDICIPLPDHEEQLAIASEVNDKISLVERQLVLIDEMQEAIVEQRTALIHQVITGALPVSKPRLNPASETSLREAA